MNVDPRDFTPEALHKVAPRCGDCPGDTRVEIVTGERIYAHRSDLWKHADGSERWWWLCCACGGYVGTHKGTITPLGSPCGDVTRKARMTAHLVFDPLWRKRMAISGISQTKARGRGYKWLAAQMGIAPKDCHIGMMTAEQARRVVEICQQARERSA